MRKPWSTAKYGECKDCGRETSLSQRDLCLECSGKRLEAVHEELRRKEGKTYQKWKLRRIKAMEREIEEMEEKKK